MFFCDGKANCFVSATLNLNCIGPGFQAIYTIIESFKLQAIGKHQNYEKYNPTNNNCKQRVKSEPQVFKKYDTTTGLSVKYLQA